MKKFYSISFLIIALFALLFTQNSFAQITSFNSPVLIAGTDNSQGASYRFSNVQPGIDAIVSVDSIIGGAVLKDIDKNGFGYTQAFQPFIQPPNAVNTSAYIVFTMKFVTTATTNPINLTTLSMTALDIDGDNFIKEFDIIDMNGGVANYMIIPSEISISSVGTGFRGINIAGNEHGAPDTTQKSDIFTVTKLNVSQLVIKAGTQGITTSNAARKYSFIAAPITYSSKASFFSLTVKLVSFTASLNSNSKVDLKWTTSSEINVSHFAIEKSIDGINFSDAGLVFSYGGAAETTNYTYADNISNNQSGVVYYRLRSVDNDGKFEYSQTRIIRITKQTEKIVSIVTYPNPATNEVRITIPSNWQNKKVVYEVFNANGKTAKKIETTNSSQTETINVSNLVPGFYIVKVSSEGQTAQQKIIKQ